MAPIVCGNIPGANNYFDLLKLALIHQGRTGISSLDLFQPLRYKFISYAKHLKARAGELPGFMITLRKHGGVSNQFPN